MSSNHLNSVIERYCDVNKDICDVHITECYIHVTRVVYIFMYATQVILKCMLWIYCWFILINLPGDNKLCLDFHQKNDLFEFIWSYPAKKILLLKKSLKKDLCFYRWSFLIVWNTNLRCSTAHYSWTNFLLYVKDCRALLQATII